MVLWIHSYNVSVAGTVSDCFYITLGLDYVYSGLLQQLRYSCLVLLLPAAAAAAMNNNY